MCGIAGIRYFDGRHVDPESLSAMAKRLHHRGPDDLGCYADGAVGLAHTRLSIIDLGGSRQPMTGAVGAHHLVFNGEILNYRELRASTPYPYRTSGDTEVLLAMYERFGAEGVTRLRGQFAYALHDDETGETHLVRDRLGILPLYYYADAGMIAFASEIKALLPVIPSSTVDTDSLHDYLAHRSVPAPFTMITGVRKLPPGHRLVVTAEGRVHVRPYWAIDPVRRRTHVAPEDAVRLVRNALRDSIAEALIADVPVGAYLSGGVDSSLITAMVAEHRAGAGVSTYSAGFGDSRVDETEWARRVAAVVGSDHHEVLVSPDDFRDSWAALSWHRDAPLSEPADVAVFRLAELARRDVKVVLSGEGSDELFGGYPKHRYSAATRWAGALPAVLRGPLLRRVERALPARGARLGIALRALAERTAAERMRAWFAPFASADRAALLGPAVRETLTPYENGRGDALRRMLYADAHTWLADNLLERGDRMSMAASLELRPPFLDHRLVELAFRLPSDVKVRGGTTKWVVKEVARRYLPDSVVDRPKSGFRVPLDAWFRHGLRDMANDLLTGPSSFVASTMDRDVVRNLLADHDSGARDEQSRLWTLLSLEMWHRELVARRDRT
ncbi:asparagine synthase (glutamine-hydrolysing) [Herbihabitans rhizosphaerae]|uniref:asparagine synthase (glutamine-hydrolyzing) n=1 Tax=Herbihabitans rhizosphaerae TaxID=1872711 RepID=A0A4V2EUI3_9PSEU|nr:asparagine synthase (glutamine-hydrolyzing) [Herbihabitans rhizosphaerae]RZS44673.1 asparagine synthase (glutamine-hydrolysing) [Herbihabitans rhizosphaerae]